MPAVLVATASPPAAGELAHRIAASALRDDHGDRLRELAAAVAADPPRAASVIAVLAAAAAALGGLAAGR